MSDRGTRREEGVPEMSMRREKDLMERDGKNIPVESLVPSQR